MIIEPKSNNSKIVGRYITYLMVALLLAVVHVVLIKFIALEGLTPDLLLILCVWITLSEGRFVGLIAAFVCGILFDLITTDIIGSNALAKTIAALIAGWFYKEASIQHNLGSYRFLGIVLLSSVIHNMVYFFMYIKYSEIRFIPFFMKYGLAISLYTTVIAIFPMLMKFPRNRLISR